MIAHVPASSYERELKGILEADIGVLKRIIKKCNAETSRKYLLIEKNPFMVIRAAGSLGFDLLAVRCNLSIPIEVKSSISGTVPFTSNSSRELKQAELFQSRCTRVGLFPLYALRLKGAKNDAWRVFTLEMGEVNDGLNEIYESLPRIDKTRGGNYVLRWENGKPLSDFIEMLCSQK